jgi:uncharacterized Zn-finger protein
MRSALSRTHIACGPAWERPGARAAVTTEEHDMSTTQTPAATVEVTAKDCNDNGTVFCPNPKMALWSNHPKVFIDLTHGGQGQCPYCGTAYRLKAGEVLSGGH